MANLERLVELKRQLSELRRGSFDDATFGERMLVGHVIFPRVLALFNVIQKGEES